MKIKILLATTNAFKVAEIKTLLRSFGEAGRRIQLASLKDVGLVSSVKEDGATFEENAAIKAKFYAARSDMLTLAEDSGIVVGALNGKPGVLSARFAGRGKDDAANCRKLIRLIRRLPVRRRKAKFVCAMALARGRRLIGLKRGEVSGLVIDAMRGRRGFGYDPMFYYPPFKKTFGEVGASEKNRVSHRYRALRKMVRCIASSPPDNSIKTS
jgi:XTP/dITP diphosphohydrolase